MKKCTIITTINNPQEAVNLHANNKEYDLIIVGDKKTPTNFSKINCIFLDLKKQNNIFPKLSKMIPLNHYTRKNIGYLYAIKENYDVIYETDDDNIPYENFDDCLNFNYENLIESNQKWINFFKLFSDEKNIWPRGFPLSLLQKEQKFKTKKTNKKPSIINGLVNGDPDVDSLFRLIVNKKIKWKKNIKFLASNENICVFNSQNTFWTDPEIFHLMLLPCSVSFRYCDIIRSNIVNLILKKYNKNISYISPNVMQKRNIHNNMDDFRLEIEMFLKNEIEIKKEFKDVCKVYEHLYKINILKKIDFEICKEWMKNVESF